MCSGVVIFVDMNTGESTILGDMDMIVEGNSINFTTGQLFVGRHYNLTATVYNVAGMATISTTISKTCSMELMLAMC